MSAPPRRLRDRGTGMSMTVKTVMRWLKGPILLFGIYMVVSSRQRGLEGDLTHLSEQLEDDGAE